MTVVVVRQNKAVVKVVQSSKPTIVTTSSRGLPGLPGIQGPAGPAGELPQSYTHNQSDPEIIWIVNHNLGFRPGGVLVTDSGGNEVEGIVSHIDANTLTITFLAAFGGFAYLS